MIPAFTFDLTFIVISFESYTPDLEKPAFKLDCTFMMISLRELK